MAFHLEAILRLYGLVEIGIHRDLVQIDDRAAAGANKVTVGSGICVEALLPVYHAHALDGTLLLKEEQVAVNSTQTQVWVSGFITL